MAITVFSFGGGIQSTAALVLAAQGKLDYRTFLFCNVGDDSEHPATLAYVHNVAMPYAQAHNIALIELQKHQKNGQSDSVLQRLERSASSIGIPVRMANGAPGNRTCTVDFKVRVVDAWLRKQGAKKQGAIVGIGFSLDEVLRMKPNTDKETMAWKENAFPLVDLRLDRAACTAIIAGAGLPIPPKSSCYFCPFHSPRKWQEMREDEPVLFAKSVALEQFINERRERLGKDHVWLTRFNKPLDKVTTDEATQAYLWEDQQCDSGYCFL